MQTTQASATPIAFSGKIPDNYDQYLGPMFFEPNALDMANRIGQLHPSRLLELASGTGRLTKMLPKVIGKNCEIIASDLNPAMVNYGKEKTKELNLEWKVVDATELPFEDESFDCIAVQFGVMFYSDKVRAFREAFRVLKPGGTLIFNVWDKIENNPMAQLANDTLRYFFPIDTPAFYSVPFSYYNMSEVAADLKAAGFTHCMSEKTEHTGYSPSAFDAAQGLIKGTPTITAIEDRDPAIVAEVLNHLTKLIVARFGEKNLRVPLSAHVITVMKNYVMEGDC